MENSGRGRVTAPLCNSLNGLFCHRRFINRQVLREGEKKVDGKGFRVTAEVKQVQGCNLLLRD